MGGQALLEMFSENIRDAEKKALNSFCTASTPLLYEHSVLPPVE